MYYMCLIFKSAKKVEQNNVYLPMYLVKNVVQS